MKRAEKHRFVLLLMVASQLLLTLFVIYWLRSQYLIEKSRLREHLTGLYIDIQDEIVDTMLFKSYVNPVLNDSVVISHSKGATEWKGINGALTVRMESDDSIKRHSDTIRFRKINDEMLLRSVRLIVRHTTDSANGGQPVQTVLKVSPDSARFMKHFMNRLDTSGMRFRLFWNSEGEHSQKNLIHINVLNPFSLPRVSVSGFSGYLFREIMPQTVFGLALIIITALAFFIAYRNMRDHIIMGKLRNEFISNITHELKTPVSTISVALESIGKYNIKNNPGLMDEYIRLASSETRRLEELVNRVLDHSLLEENIQAVKKEVTDITSLCHDTAVTMRHKFDNNGKIELLSTDEHIMISCDPLYIRGVLINLIDNSIKYCDKEPIVSISVNKEGRFAVISVSDNGPGIPEEYHGRIFDKFFRVPADNIHNVKGYGLGLSFAALVMKLHNGVIELRNRDEGCTFILRLPLG